MDAVNTLCYPAKGIKVANGRAAGMKTAHQWLTAAGMCLLTVLEARSETRCRQGRAPSTASRRRSFCAFLQSLAAPGCPWLLTACLLSLLVFPRLSSLCVSLPLHVVSFCKETSHSGLGSSLLQYDPILIDFICTDCFPIRSLSEVLRASLEAQTVKKLPAVQETWVQSLGREDPLEEDGAPPQDSCLENPMGLASYTVHGVSKSWTGLRDKLSLRTRISIYLFFGGRGNTIQPATKII
ncbi:unnamed protein product [Rangifer tarandus platyrhynchus]|uniref:Uncharacterized protein n=1 Tax=Rangifer tarandus platyrhynchus TaxID=3082113 RepID=A0ABN9A3D1_RANTA|nr:unnamed protein product [Rangifer tarandus platyrhynchus]